MSLISALFVRDIKTIWRESFVMFGVCVPFVMALILRVTIFLMEKNIGIPGAMSSQYGLLMSLMLIVTSPMMMGTAGGFIILDDRDQGILRALNVTPLQTHVYLIYRLSFLSLLSFVAILLSIPVCGLIPFNLWMIPTVFVAVMLVPLTALFIATFAGNKVEGFAMMKASGFFLMAPLASFFITNNWQYLFGLLPTYWSMKGFVFVANRDPLLIPFLIVGFAFQGLLLLWIVRVFANKTRLS
jgi:fluoroquinolone transport system permease protein